MTTDKQKRMMEIVDETIQNYETNPRSIDEEEDHCLYYDETNGNMCALGRCMNDPQSFAQDITSTAWNLVPTEENIDKLLKPEYHGFTRKFWVDIQELHDSSVNWIKNGIGGARLTSAGIVEVKHLKEKIVLDYYDE